MLHSLVIGWLYEVGCDVVIAKVGYRLGTGLVKEGIALAIEVKIGYRVGYSLYAHTITNGMLVIGYNQH